MNRNIRILSFASRCGLTLLLAGAGLAHAAKP